MQNRLSKNGNRTSNRGKGHNDVNVFAFDIVQQATGQVEMTMHISTSYVERQDLTMGMHMRRFTRLTNAFSKKLENHIAAVSLHFMYYNFVRVHQTLRVTPAMAAGVTDRLWEVLDIVKLLDELPKNQNFNDSHYGPALGPDPIGRRQKHRYRKFSKGRRAGAIVRSRLFGR